MWNVPSEASPLDQQACATNAAARDIPTRPRLVPGEIARKALNLSGIYFALEDGALVAGFGAGWRRYG